MVEGEEAHSNTRWRLVFFLVTVLSSSVEKLLLAFNWFAVSIKQEKQESVIRSADQPFDWCSNRSCRPVNQQGSVSRHGSKSSPGYKNKSIRETAVRSGSPSKRPSVRGWCISPSSPCLMLTLLFWSRDAHINALWRWWLMGMTSGTNELAHFESSTERVRACH